MAEQVSGKLFERIAAVMAAVRKLPEDGYNKHDNYKYTTAATAVEHVGKSMADNGLVVVPMIVHEATERPQGEKAFYSTVEVDFHICDVDGNSFVSRWVGQGVNYRTPDKALKTALTNAETTFLLKLFLVGAGDDDPERDSEAEPPQDAPRQQPKQRNGQPKADEKLLKRLHALGTGYYGDRWDDERHRLVKHITDGESESAKDLTPAQAQTLISGLQTKVNEREAQKAKAA